MTYYIFLLVKLPLLESKSLFAIYQKRIIFHFAAFGDCNFCSMLVSVLKEAGKMGDRGAVEVLLSIYNYHPVYNLLKMSFFALPHK